MEYRDKSTGRTIHLDDSRTTFLAIVEPEAESLRALVFQRIFRVVSSSSDDGVVILEVRSEAENEAEVIQAIENLRSQSGVQAVVPALINGESNVRFALPGTVVVQFSDVPIAAVRRIARSLRSAVARRIRSTSMYELRVPAGTDVGAFIERLNAEDAVLFAEPAFYGVDDADIRVSVTHAAGDGSSGTGGAGVNEPGSDESTSPLPWNLTIVEVAAAWQRTRGNPDIVVAVLDGMPEASHEALSGKLVGPITDDQIFATSRTVSSHATNICGLIAGESEDYSGIAPGVRLLPLVIDLSGQLYADRAAAIHFAAACARRRRVGSTPFVRMVLSCSWRTAGDTAVIRTALQQAVAAGMVVVCSAGNGNSDALHYPSGYSAGPADLAEGVVAVAATDQDDRKAEYSNFSPTIDLAAPGGDGLPIDQRDIRCAEQGNTYGFAAGTSIAAPHVSAVVALMLSIDPELTPARLKNLLVAGADAIDRKNVNYQGLLGAGRLNARKVLAAVAPAQTPSEEPPAPAPDRRAGSKSGPRVTIRVGRGPRVSIQRGGS